MVAKSYKECEQIGEPFKENGKMYVIVKTKSNPNKKVRWYTEAEYKKMYPEEKVNVGSAKITYPRANDHILKGILGFGTAPNDFIYLPKGYDANKHKDYFFNAPNVRCCGWWGYFFNNDAELPSDLPFGIELIKLPWDSVGNPDGTLKPKDMINEVLGIYLYDEDTKEYFGIEGQRYDLKLKVIKALRIEGYYGSSTMHIMEDESKNQFLWTTSSKNLEEDVTYQMRGTIKKHQVYEGKKQNVLTRCMNIERCE